MRKDFGIKPWIMPQPVLMIGTYDKDDNPNLMNAAWGGTYDMDKVIIALSKHKTTENLKLHKAFTLSFATKSTVEASDYVGMVSGNSVKDKIARAKLTPIKSSKVHAPMFEEYPLTMECEVEKFDEEEGVLIGKVKNVSVDEKYIKNGKINSEALEIICFDPINNKYRIMGKEIADAFRCGLKFR